MTWLGANTLSVLWLEFNPSVLSRLASSLFTFGGPSSSQFPAAAQWCDCAEEGEAAL